jgi:hypothetical protein
VTHEHPDPDAHANAIADHIIEHIGPITSVFHEVTPDIVQIDLLVVGPQEEKPFTTLVTCGMSDRAMRVPIEDPDDLARIPELRYSELLLCLPADWPLSTDAFKDEANYWPVRWLKRLARLPHQMEAWLGLGHTIPNGDPPRPFAGNTTFSGWLVDEPVLFHSDVQKLRTVDKAINFYSIVPLYEGEMTLKLRKGSGALSHLLDQAKVSELVDVNRRNVAIVNK